MSNNLKLSVKIILVSLMILTAHRAVFTQALNFAWAKQYGGAANVNPLNLRVNANGSIYSTGIFFQNGVADFDPGLGNYNLVTSGYFNAFVSKLDKSGNFLWAKQFGAIDPKSMVLDGNSNILITGRFGGTTDFDPSPTGTYTMATVGSGDIFVVKLDSSGNFLWAKCMGSTLNDQGESIAVDGSGNVYTTGYFQGTADFNPGTGTSNLVSAGSYDLFVQKLDPNGNYLWAKRIGNSNQDYGKCIAIDPSGNVVTTGNFSGTVDFDPGGGTQSLTASGVDNMFVSKLSIAGNYVSAIAIQGSLALPLDMAIDANSNVQVIGWFTALCDFDPGAGTTNLFPYGSRDAFIYKLNAAGNLLWAKQLGGFGNTEAWGIALDGLGNSFTIGRFDNMADLDPGPGVNQATSAGDYDLFCVNLDASGNLVWPYHYGSDLNESYADIACTPNGSVFSTGNSWGRMDCDPGPATFLLDTVGGNAAFVHKISQCSPTDSMATIAACSTFTVDGYTFTSSAAYVKTFQNALGCDSVFTLNIEIKNNDTSLTVAACDSFSLNNQTYLSSGTYSQLLTNVAGCDSLIMLDLTIRNSSAYVLADTACGNYTLNGQTYNASGTYVQHLPNSAGCDSTIVLALVVHQPSSATITATSCNYFTLNGQTYTQQGVYVQHLTNTAGCDSLLTLNLTLEFALPGITQSGNTLTAIQNSAMYQWVECNGYSPISGAIQQSFTPSVSGNYAVIVTNGNCSDTSLCTAITVVGLNEKPSEAQIHCFPNPTDGSIAIELSQRNGIVTVSVLNALGQMIARRSYLESDRIQLDMPCEGGLYFVKVETNEGKEVVKVVRK